ncbi:hypothetical protein N7488_002199 [Penicillium malachiteum]|nr:hypothetical protein N7488_002199 [Penicillium malachiteum]
MEQLTQRIVEKELNYLSDDLRSFVIDRLSDLSRGSAIWTKSVVSPIKSRKIRSYGLISAFLEDEYLPNGLSELYNKLICRTTLDDSDNEEVVSTALRILAICQRSLSILELGWAVTLSTTANLTTVSALSALVDHQRVMGLIQSFIASVDFGDLKKRQVRLSHQSVKEFIVNNWSTLGSPLEKSPVPTRNEKSIAGQRFENLETFILGICIRYLLLEDVGLRNLFSGE